MLQGVPFADAKRRNPAINRLAYGITFLPKSPEIPRRRDRKTRASRLHNFEAVEFAQDALEQTVVAIALQNFAQNQVGKPQTLPLEFPVQPVALRIPCPAEIVDPDGRINDYHG